jgi:biotin-(acetyl-CoA carboxylase) ligase
MELGDGECIAKAYAERSIMPGKRIFVREGGREYFAKALGIGRDLSLRVLTDTEELRELSSADVAIKM